MSQNAAANKIQKKCALCDKVADKLCSGCGDVAYCSKEHQKEHWASHKAACKQKSASKAVSSSSSSSAASSKEVPVTWEDQQRINRFSRLNARFQRIEDELKVIENEVANTEDASGELETVLDDNAAKIKLGEVFVDVCNEEAEEFVKSEKKKKKKEVKTKTDEKAVLAKEMESLKTLLYAKFGSQINLESSEQTVAS